MAFPLRNSAIRLAIGALALAASLGLASSRTGPACIELAAPAEPGFVALAQRAAPACIRIRLR